MTIKLLDRRRLGLRLLVSLLLNNGVSGFSPPVPNHMSRANYSHLPMAVNDDSDPPLPGKMKISEIKSELDLRSVSYSDCFDRESLELRLNEARCQGKADPSILDRFNKANEEAAKDGRALEIEDRVLEGALGGDGTLPGGMPPDMLTEMLGKPEVVDMLRNPKMQEVMRLVMTGGQDAFEEAMKNDPEMFELIQKLNGVVGGMNNK